MKILRAILSTACVAIMVGAMAVSAFALHAPMKSTLTVK